VRRAALVILVAFAGCGGGTAPAPAPPAPPAPAPVPAAAAAMEESVLAGSSTVIATPTEPNGRAVLYVHGVGEDHRSILTSPMLSPLANALLEAGYTVAASNGAGNAWGNLADLQAHAALAAALQGRGLALYVLAQSMGGVAATQLIDVVRPQAWAGIFPVCDVSSVHRLDRYAASIDAAWPQGAPGPVRAQNVQGLRMIFWHSPQDTQVPKAENTDVCAAQARLAGADVEVVETTGDHGDPSNFDPDRLLAAFG
jgi:hypothetical protein